MKLFSKIKNNKWVRIISNKYLIITVLFIFWMLFFDTNSFLIHQELNNEIKKLEKNTVVGKKFYDDQVDEIKLLQKECKILTHKIRSKIFKKAQNG